MDYAKRAKNGLPEEERPRQFQPDGSYAPNDLSWYANIPVPTSYMCMGTSEAFFGGYDHRAKAGIVHVADPHISPGKKQWTWGNQEFGYAWDRLLTDPDASGVCRPYVELMAGVYTDNQPDFSYLQPGETKTWMQHWYPIREIGPADHANELCAVSLHLDGRVARIGVHTPLLAAGARICLRAGGKELASLTRNLSPAQPVMERVRLRRSFALHDLELRVEVEGREWIVHRPRKPRPAPPEAELQDLAATEPPAPRAIASADELYITGLHLEQYRHATRCPVSYWREALCRDAGDSRCNLALGRWHLRRGEFANAERHLRASIARLTLRNPNPADGEAHYQLGRALRFLGHDDEACVVISKATWNQAWAGAGHHALAEIALTAGRTEDALGHLDMCLVHGSENLRAHALKAHVLRRLGRGQEACALVREALQLDPLDPWLRHLNGQPWCGGNGTRLDVAFDMARAGLLHEALEVLHAGDFEAVDGTVPMMRYTEAWLLRTLGNPTAAEAAQTAAREAAPDYCFPSRLEEIVVLESAIAADPSDPRAPLYLGHLLYDRRRHREAIARWEAAAKAEPSNAVTWRCLGIGYFNALGKPGAARRAFARARTEAPDDARLLYEADQLAKRMGEPPARRLRSLERHAQLVARRDDLTVELCALYNQTGQPLKAMHLLASRQFQPWEGGEGMALGQHVRCHLLLARERLAASDFKAAIATLQDALRAPENLGESKHPLANQSDIHYWMGEALAAAGRSAQARAEWQRAADFRGDFQQMSVCAFSEMTYFSAEALRRLGKLRAADCLLGELLTHAKALEKATAKIDYFATSLPTMLLFDEDIQARQITASLFLQAQAQLGLGHPGRARRLLEKVLARDPSHALAADFFALTESAK